MAALPKVPWQTVNFTHLKPLDAFGRSGSPLARAIARAAYESARYRNRAQIEARIQSGERMFLGNYLEGSKAHLRHMANLARPAQLILLDDGTDAVTVNDQRRAWETAGSRPGYPPRRTRAGRLQRLRDFLGDRILDWHEQHYPSVTFFSAYDLDVAATDRLVPNRYDYLRGLQRAQGTSEEVLVLGQCLVEDQYLDLPTYVHEVVSLCARFRSNPIVYVPHPRETSDTIRQVESATAVQVRRFDLPVEYTLLRAPQLPKAVASFFCSALVSCNALFGNSLKVYATPIDSQSLKHQRYEVARFYEHLRLLSGTNLVVLAKAA